MNHISQATVLEYGARKTFRCQRILEKEIEHSSRSPPTTLFPSHLRRWGGLVKFYNVLQGPRFQRLVNSLGMLWNL